MATDLPIWPVPSVGEGAERRIGRATLRGDRVPEGLARLPDRSFDLAIADPPYGASSNADWHLDRGHGRSGFGGPWRLADHVWDRPDREGGAADSRDRGDARRLWADFSHVTAWLAQLGRVIRPTGSLWIHATYHNSGLVNLACQALGLEIINEVIWYKRNAFPNLSGRRLTASHETLLWVHTGRLRRAYRFNYKAAREAWFPEDRLKTAGRQLRTVWDIPTNKTADERNRGRHPTQKPLRLVERMLLVSATPGGRLLVPFAGSGTEMVAGLRFGLECLGFESDPVFFDLAFRRIADEVGRAGGANDGVVNGRIPDGSAP